MEERSDLLVLSHAAYRIPEIPMTIGANTTVTNSTTSDKGDSREMTAELNTAGNVEAGANVGLSAPFTVLYVAVGPEVTFSVWTVFAPV